MINLFSSMSWSLVQVSTNISRRCAGESLINDLSASSSNFSSSSPMAVMISSAPAFSTSATRPVEGVSVSGGVSAVTLLPVSDFFRDGFSGLRTVCRQNISDVRFDILRECLAHLV